MVDGHTRAARSSQQSKHWLFAKMRECVEEKDREKKAAEKEKKEVRISNTPPGARTKRWEINVKQAKRQAPEMRKRKG